MQGATGGDAVDGTAALPMSSWKPGAFPDLKACMQERDFHIKIAKEKRKVCIPNHMFS